MDQVKFLGDGLWKTWSAMICLSRLYHIKFFKGCLSQMSLGPFMNIVSHIINTRLKFCTEILVSYSFNWLYFYNIYVFYFMNWMVICAVSPLLPFRCLKSKMKRPELNLFKVNNKETRTSLTSFSCLSLKIFHTLLFCFRC